MDVSVVTIPLCEVQYNPRGFDSNNHPAHQLPRHERPVGYPDEYRDIIARTHYSRWRALKGVEDELDFVLTWQECQTICEAGMSGAHLTLNMPESHREEIERIAARLDMPRPPYFARLDGCSTKGGKSGVGPFHTPIEVLTALVTSGHCCDFLKRVARERSCATLYLLPWRADIDPDREFRAFVRGWRLTAISQYKWWEDCGWSERAHDLPTIALNIERLVGVIRDRNHQLELNLPSNFCMDVFCRADLSVDLIELNSFGAQLAAGSCLFHWLKDYDQLYGLGEGRLETEDQRAGEYESEVGRDAQPDWCFKLEFRVVRPTDAREEALLDLEGRGFSCLEGSDVDDLLLDVRHKLAALDDLELEEDSESAGK